MLEPAGIVSWGGFSITLACLYGIAAALLWDDGWDYFINLSTSDFPVMTQVCMRTTSTICANRVFEFGYSYRGVLVGACPNKYLSRAPVSARNFFVLFSDFFVVAAFAHPTSRPPPATGIFFDSSLEH